ncbi:MAG: hypothetical protein ABR574_00345 [Cryomorphaceae bacterium]|nr:hypothetical protein [Flavobacteriales bacterium]
MDRVRAILILGAEQSGSTNDELEEFYEEAVFEQASFFMRRPFHPILARARITKLQKIEEAAQTLELSTSDSDANPKVEVASSPSSVLEVVREYQIAESKLKLILSRTLSAREAISIFDSWMGIFSVYAKGFVKCYESVNGQIPTGDVKLSINVDIGELLGELEKENYSDLAFLEYGRLKKTLD